MGGSRKFFQVGQRDKCCSHKDPKPTFGNVTWTESNLRSTHACMAGYKH